MRYEDEIVRDVLTWEGTPYVAGAHIKGVGVDCGGLLYEVYNPYFGPFPPYPHYEPDWALHGRETLYLDFIMPFVHEVPIVTRGGFTLYHIGLHYAHAAIWDGERYNHAWGRTRQGSVTRTPPRVMQYLANKSGFKPMHFEPN